MPGLWRDEETGENVGKYLVLRRDGTQLDGPYFVIGARDPAAPEALRAYAQAAKRYGMDDDYTRDVMALAFEFEGYRLAHGDGDPDAPRHREDDPEITRRMREGT